MCNPKGTVHFIVNPGSTERCGTCDRRKGMCFLRNHAISPPTISVGGGAGGNGKGPGKGKGQGKGTFVREVSPQEPKGPRQEPINAEVEKLKATVAKLQGELMAKAVAGAPVAGLAPAVAGLLKSPADIDKELAGMEGEAGASADLVRKQLLAAREAGVLREEDAEVGRLRKEIAGLDNMDDVQEAKDRKQARLDHLVETRRLAKPLSSRIRDVEDLCERRAKAVTKAKADGEECTRELVEAQKRADEAAQEVQNREEKLQEAEVTRAELYKQKADEAAGRGDPGTHDGDGQGKLAPELAAAAEAVLKKLSAEGLGFDPGALGILRAVLTTAKLGNTTSPPGESSVPPGKAGAAAGSSDGVDQDMPDVDAMAALAEFLAADDGKGGEGQQDREKKFLQVLRSSRKERTGPY